MGILKKYLAIFSCLIIIISSSTLSISCKDPDANRPTFSTKIRYKPNFKFIKMIPNQIVSLSYVQIINPIPGEKIHSVVPNNDLIETGFDQNEHFFIKAKEIGKIIIYLTYKNAEDLKLEIEIKENIKNLELVNFDNFNLETNLREIKLNENDGFFNIKNKILNCFFDLNKEYLNSKNNDFIDITEKYDDKGWIGWEYNEKSYRDIFINHQKYFLPDLEEGFKLYHGHSIKIEYTLIK